MNNMNLRILFSLRGLRGVFIAALPLVFGVAELRAQSGAAVSTAVLTVEQFYRPASVRDPLVASTIYGDETVKAGSFSVATATFSVYNLALAGIMEDNRSKEAMLSDPRTGRVYILKAGRLLDAKKKQVPGVSGVIKGKQVILMTEDKKIHQLTMREKE